MIFWMLYLRIILLDELIDVNVSPTLIVLCSIKRDTCFTKIVARCAHQNINSFRKFVKRISKLKHIIGDDTPKSLKRINYIQDYAIIRNTL